MDTNDYPSMPDLSQLHARLAVNSRRVEAIVDSQIDNIERLFRAATAEDWPTVAQVSRYLANLTPNTLGADVVREARYVFDELSHKIDRQAQGGDQPMHLHNLLAACRAVRKNWSA